MIYLDSAATSLYKPESVSWAMLDAVRSMASPGRGAHAAALRAAECCYDCREKLARLLHAPEPERVVFTFNATHGLNIAIRSLVRPGTRVFTTGYEHNAVVRPLHALGARVVEAKTPLFDPEAFLDAARREVPLAEVVICCHVSNVFGFIQPLEELAELCRMYEKPLIVDASQSAGTLPLDFEALGAEFLAMPGHKGLLGPQGTGVLLCKKDAKALLYGGSGSESLSPEMPEFLPDRLEAGTHNVTGVAGLSAGLDWLLEQGTERVLKTERELLDELAQALGALPGLRVFRSRDARVQTGVLSVQPLDMDCEAFADALSREGVAVRAGLHCAPAAHRSAGTLERGTVRFSLSPFNTPRQIGECAEICKKILK